MAASYSLLMVLSRITAQPASSHLDVETVFRIEAERAAMMIGVAQVIGMKPTLRSFFSGVRCSAKTRSPS